MKEIKNYLIIDNKNRCYIVIKSISNISIDRYKLVSYNGENKIIFYEKNKPVFFIIIDDKETRYYLSSKKEITLSLTNSNGKRILKEVTIKK
tara:strand:+ start:236 stop:511 length:276 start_codon:yes stop_codon:yes gene_type:complete